MPKKLIKKGQWGTTAEISNQLMKSVGMNFSQPSTFSSGLFKSKIMSSNNLALPLPNTGNMLSNAGLSVPKGPDISKIGSDLTNKVQANVAKEVAGSASKVKFGEFLGKNMGAISSIGGSAFDIAGSMLGKTTDGGLTDGIVDGVSQVAGMFGPWGQAAGLALKGLNFADKALGKSTKSININSGISGYGGSDLNKQGKDFRVTQGRARKMDVYDTKQKAKLAMAGKMNAQDQLQQGQARLQAIGNTGMENQKKLSGGLDFSVLTAKKGATLQDIRNYIKVRNIEKEVVENPNLEDNLAKSEIQKFQNGGSLIPSGALHKNKHNLESINSELDGEITKKGIPVISYAEEGDVLEYENDGKTPKVLAKGGEVIQHAEIEKEEIILNLSLTKKLIELMKKDTPEAMIQAGKILARELMESTTDNTGLIEKTIGNED